MSTRLIDLPASLLSENVSGCPGFTYAQLLELVPEIASRNMTEVKQLIECLRDHKFEWNGDQRHFSNSSLCLAFSIENLGKCSIDGLEQQLSSYEHDQTQPIKPAERSNVSSATPLRIAPTAQNDSLEELKRAEADLEQQINDKRRKGSQWALGPTAYFLLYLVYRHISHHGMPDPGAIISGGLLLLVVALFAWTILAIPLEALFCNTSRLEKARWELKSRISLLEEKARAAEIEAERKYCQALQLRTDEVKRLTRLHYSRLDRLRTIDPYAFEQLIRDYYESQGHKTELTKQSGDAGVDIWLHKNNKRVAVQCKRFGEAYKVGRPEIQKFCGALRTQGADSGIFVTTAEFSNTAIEAAAKVGLKLIDGTTLHRMLALAAASDSYDYKIQCSECETISTANARTCSTELKCRCGAILRMTISEAELDQSSSANPRMRRTPPTCPRCGSNMIRKRRSGAKKTDSGFWRCSNFPSCTGSLPVKCT